MHTQTVKVDSNHEANTLCNLTDRASRAPSHYWQCGLCQLIKKTAGHEASGIRPQEPSAAVGQNFGTIIKNKNSSFWYVFNVRDLFKPQLNLTGAKEEFDFNTSLYAYSKSCGISSHCKS